MSTLPPLEPAYVIWGEDRATVERALQRLVGRVARDGGLEPERMRAEETPAEMVVAACEALSFAGLRLVVVEGADTWKAADAAPLVAYLAQPNPATCLALVAGGAVTPKLEAAVAALGRPPASKKKLASTLLRYGPDPKASKADREKWLVAHAQAEAERAGGAMSASVARALVERVVVDRPAARTQGLITMELTQEARKLAAYAGGEQIGREMVELLVARHPDARVYELSDAVVAGRAPAAFGLLQDMATGDEPVAPIVVQVQLTNHFRRVATVQALGPRPSQDAVSAATGQKGYPVRKLIEHAEALPAGAGQTAVARLAALELDLRVSAFTKLGRTSVDGARMVLELAVRDLLILARGGTPAPGHGA